MSTQVEAVLGAFKELPLGERREVFKEIMRSLQESAIPSVSEDPIRSARGMFAGSGLTEALLASRAEERRRG